MEITRGAAPRRTGQDEYVSNPSAVVLDLARRNGLSCEELLPLRSTNNTVFLLAPCAVVAKVHGSELAATRELAAGLALAHLGAPVVPPAAGIGDEVRSAGGLHVTFWNYVPDGNGTGCSSEAVAVALCELHRHLDGLADVAGDRTVDEQLHDAIPRSTAERSRRRSASRIVASCARPSSVRSTRCAVRRTQSSMDLRTA